MKLKLLFVMNHLDCGGAEKALVSLLQVIDYERYEVDLLLFKQEGLFLGHVPKQVRVLVPPADYRYYDMPLKEAALQLLKKGAVRGLLARLYLGLVMRTEGNAAKREQLAWRHIVRTFEGLEGSYDAAVGFLEKTPIYYIVDKVEAKTKIGWIHTDYVRMGMDARLDEPYFRRLDHIVTVSEECGGTLRREFANYTGKIKVIQNIVSPAVIRRMSEGKSSALSVGSALTGGSIRILTIARLHHAKGIDLAIEAASLLVDRGYPIHWTVLGEGGEEERAQLEALIQKRGLESRFKLPGAVDNPYPYLKAADIVVQPSRFEGKSIAIDEAKILGKPIVTTNYSTVTDQIHHGSNGWIVEMQPRAIAEGIGRLIEEPELRAELASRLADERLGTEEEVVKLYELVHEQRLGAVG
ncbi:glycosyltransferase [Paenibacillus sp. GCM10027627]|uniref:glycosyltransferase n=1 Tax=unclassified Paenibacillus TaxID=185978 RepID=UPI003643E8CD